MNITIKEIAAFLTFIVTLISSIEYISLRLKKNISNIIKDEITELNNKLGKLEEQNKELELNSDKNFLVRFLSDVEQGSMIDEVEEERFWETYERYHNLGGNSYIDHKVDKLKEEGKL